MSGFSPRVARQAFERDHGCCFRCRRVLHWHQRGMGFSIHHRRPRQMGGSRDPEIGSIANALTLCGSGTTGCHGWVEKYRAIAEDHGYIVRRGINTVAGTRIKKSDGTWWLLTESGLAVEVEGSGTWA